jgi:hypothetical protein
MNRYTWIPEKPAYKMTDSQIDAAYCLAGSLVFGILALVIALIVQ